MLSELYKERFKVGQYVDGAQFVEMRTMKNL